MTETHTEASAQAGTALTLAALHQANIIRQAEWCAGGDPEPDLAFRGVELAGETGEALNVIKKIERERRGWRGSRATLADLAEELADVVICADLCAVSAGIDLGAAVVSKFNATSAKVGLTTMLSPRSETVGAGTETREAGHLREVAQALLNACVEDMGYGDEAGDFPDPDDEPVGRGATKPCAVQFGHLRHLRNALAAPAQPTPPAVDGVEALRVRGRLDSAIKRMEAHLDKTAPFDERVLPYWAEVRAAALATRTPAGAAGDPVGEAEHKERLAEALYLFDRNKRSRFDTVSWADCLGSTRAKFRDMINGIWPVILATRPASQAPAASAGDADYARRIANEAVGMPANWPPAATLAPTAHAQPAGREYLTQVIEPWISSVCSDGNSDSRVVAARIADAILAARPVADGGAEQAAIDVLAERRRQVDAEGWTPEHDDQHAGGEMAWAAGAYALHAAGMRRTPEPPAPHEWPWAWSRWKPTDPRRDLVKAGALILAEIERLDRATPPTPAAAPATQSMGGSDV